VVVVARCCCHCCGYSHGAIKFVGLPELQLADIVWLSALSVVIIVDEAVVRSPGCRHRLAAGAVGSRHHRYGLMKPSSDRRAAG
jgi:hypothetical protein